MYYKKIKSIRAHQGNITTIQFLNESYLISGSWDKRIKIWEFDGEEVHCVHELEHDQMVDRILITLDREYLIGVGSNSSIRVWETQDFSEVMKLPSNDYSCLSTTLSLDGNYIAVPEIKNWATYFDIYEIPNNEKIERVRNGYGPERRAPLFLIKSEEDQFKLNTGIVCPNKKFYISNKKGYNYWVYDFKNMQELGKLKEFSSYRTIFNYEMIKSDLDNLVFSPDSKLIAYPFNRWAGEIVSYHFNNIIFGNDNIGADFVGIVIWETKSQEPIIEFKGYKDIITDLKFSNDNSYIVSGSGDNTVKIWEIEKQQLVQTLMIGRGNDYIETIYLSDDMNYIIIGTYDGFFHIWKDVGSASEIKVSDRSLESLYDDLGKGWWNYIRLNDFGFLDHITHLKDIPASDGDILIHKAMKKGDRFPSTRYHIIKGIGSRVVSKREVNTKLVNSFIKYVDKNRKLPFACKVEKFYKNGNAKVKYLPHQYNSYPLKIIKGKHVEDTKEFLENLQTSTNPLKEKKGNEKEKNPSKNEWKVPSSSDKSKKYIVKRNINGSFSCTCPHHVYRNAECKHIKKVKEMIK